ncbi:hypothetical protein [Lacicoccus alkaliphilus]|uniref:Uncharacterized protein n=1 Tax=Lacicoccus alkaliphilus DSM 16010 TaxID=1123231 RepID=A0A1M7HGQ1_9BACL|nr:hypothetical protein [Salinicoccus alkaliphilus]SHM27608.1 hypothetical protein SAMN02745189_01858 [Salinicoccus alkaliphilus DSM 16010]
MGIFGMFKSNQPAGDENPYTLLKMEQGSNDAPTIDDVYKALELLENGQTDFVSLAKLNQEVEIEGVQAVGEMGMFTVEALPSEDTPEQGKIYYKEHLDEYSLQYYFHAYFETGKVKGLEGFEVRKS